MKTPILGSSYVARSVNAACSRMVNLFPEVVPEAGKETAWLQRAPGLRLLQAVGDGHPVRGLYCSGKAGDGMFAVVGRTLYTIADLASPAVAVDGIVYGGEEPVSIADNGTQLFISAEPYGFVYDRTTGTLEMLLDPSFPGSGDVAYFDGYFLFNEPDTQKIWITALLDGTQVDGLDFASAEGNPDNIVAVCVDHREAWLFGEASTEIWVDSGPQSTLETFPFSRLDGAFIEVGCAAKKSVTKVDNRIFWIAKDSKGAGLVMASEGYNGKRVSTHAVEWQIQQYGDVSDAIGWAYQRDGHTFYVLSFPTANATWVYDVSTDAWHERAAYVDGLFQRHRGAYACQFLGQTIVGDYGNGNLYVLDPNIYDDAGVPQRWYRSWRALQPGANPLVRMAHHSLQLDCESGVGLEGVVQGSDPQAMLRWSDDGGHTWSNEHWSTMGKAGDTGTRVMWRRLGMTVKLRDRVYEVSGTDPVKIAIMGAELVGVQEES